MTDLSYQPKKKEENTEKIGIKEILILIPFALLFSAVLAANIIHGIF